MAFREVFKNRPQKQDRGRGGRSGGLSFFIPCDKVDQSRLSADRTLDPDRFTGRPVYFWQRLLSRIHEVCQGIALTYRGSAQVECNQGYCVGNNDEAAAQDACATVRSLFGQDAMVKQYNPSMGSEDFSFYSREIPGVKLALGTGCREGLHTPFFRLDESTLPYGVAYFLALAFRL